MFSKRFGIEIEFTGITRETAAKVAAEHLNGSISNSHDYYGTQKVTALDGRVWKLMSDGSINCQRKTHGRKTSADRTYSVELVSPILTYREDIETLQDMNKQTDEDNLLASVNEASRLLLML